MERRLHFLKILLSRISVRTRSGSSDRALIGDVVITTYRWKTRLQHALLQTLAQERPQVYPRKDGMLLPGAADHVGI